MTREMKQRIIAIIGMAAAGLLLVAMAFLWRRKEPSVTEGKGQSFAMGSLVTVSLYGESGKVDAMVEKAKESIRTLDQEVISWRIEDSELGKWNRDAGIGEKVFVSPSLQTALQKGMDLSEKSGGALNLTLRPVLELWGIEEKTAEEFTVPEKEELEKAGEQCELGSLSSAVTLERGELIRHKPVTLDLGAVGKGYALDAAYDTVMAEEAADRPSGGVISVGGSVLIFGSKPDGSEFRVGIRDPEGNPEDTLGYISFPAGTGKTCISTSGGYEKYIEKDGVRYHHIIDPSTLRPSDSGLVSVTVVCADGLLSDGLSTACFVLGEEKAKRLLEQYQAEAVLIRGDGSRYVSPGLEGRVTFR